jgi:probable HAF family extracellular repeat protein
MGSLPVSVRASSRLVVITMLASLLQACGGGDSDAAGIEPAAAQGTADALKAKAKVRPYRLTDLGEIVVNPLITSTDRVGCLALNDKGQVAGSALFPGGVNEHAFLYSDGVRQDLGTLAGGFSAGCGINNKGQVTGYSRYVNPLVQRTMWHAFLYSHGAMQDLGLLVGAPLHAFSVGYGIGRKGRVTGSAPMLGEASRHAFLYSDGVMQEVGTLGTSSSEGNAINDKGQVTGSAGEQAFLSTGRNLEILGTLGGSRSVGYGINNKGQVTGAATLAGDAARHTFVYSHGVMEDLGCLDGDTDCHGLGINERGLVAGVSGTWNFADFTTRRAVLYRKGTVRDLNELVDASGNGWHLHMADGVNNSGQIVGKGVLNGAWHAFLLTPVKKGRQDD